jgi:hypothetical protein
MEAETYIFLAGSVRLVPQPCAAEDFVSDFEKSEGPKSL